MEASLPSATTVVLDLLSARHGEPMSARDVCEGCVIVGLTEAVARVAITRLLRQKKVLRQGRALYALNTAGRPLQRDVSAWRQRLDNVAPWSGDWVAVHDAGVSRRDRTLLRRHHRALDLRGFRCWSGGLWLRPDNLRGGVTALREDLGALGLGAGAQVLVASGLTREQCACIHALWDVRALAADYADRLRMLEESGRRLPGLEPRAAARECLLLGRALIGQMLRDPLLPAEMTPDAPRRHLVAALEAYQTRSREIWRAVLNTA
ncbi:hypothetical protein GCM10019059_21850 [Camelimonas fluminis]|uniref:PaaX family transcriptional regulator n=1 Tax=Camelimonas fluminis TaxID=1576911 RepID=A0ABV7UFI0_9HYPH|nr:PaaX family transcriptional regulator [Camelimonas fluminis]GHE62006.1 hypothetical protein GCM10019059_21850 [Camelimonas fluminis]